MTTDTYTEAAVIDETDENAPVVADENAPAVVVERPKLGSFICYWSNYQRNDVLIDAYNAKTFPPCCEPELRGDKVLYPRHPEDFREYGCVWNYYDPATMGPLMVIE